MANLAMPTADERTAVEDFISRYAWLMDNRRKDAVGALFAGDGTYLLCQLGVAESEVNAVGKDVAEELDASFKKLEAEKKRARRLFGNILIRKNISDGTFEVLISSVVFTQVIATQAPPEVDYMATLYATIAEDPFGTGLKFRSLTVVTDPQGIQIRAR
ncbi:MULTISPECIES: nuclear transport factor 2 family protein [unclassified Rhizobium]|uniref:nuclear transport factor 2 family protein n=1 Tax=unclassified Rhizobium TaxID=2613769 RepID=UPI0017BBACB7|nr:MULTISPECIES: nuclear transport factor 2 family protein [unclassified Rhizobium]MBB3318837.1 3-phenylpropionate/cinnamic acid dioxygenase small subunit [Rhizobium sp. BK181]MCS3742385.1 3-phenylpropionate/cinnamic acid dioxygenase small subunit [Rhizobium sp. BK661]MCS4094787.1 3-phenylpropionate/cinnamic acid dioxygenase small subunit [Rhizobium sp. BK176]